jgi:hypothetical protein
MTNIGKDASCQVLLQKCKLTWGDNTTQQLEWWKFKALTTANTAKHMEKHESHSLLWECKMVFPLRKINGSFWQNQIYSNSTTQYSHPGCSSKSENTWLGTQLYRKDGKSCIQNFQTFNTSKWPIGKWMNSLMWYIQTLEYYLVVKEVSYQN